MFGIDAAIVPVRKDFALVRPYRAQFFIPFEQVFIALAPRIATSVERVLKPFHTHFVAVVHARHAGESILQRRGEFNEQFSFVLVLYRRRRFIVLARNVSVVAQHGHEPRRVVIVEHVHQAVNRMFGIIIYHKPDRIVEPVAVAAAHIVEYILFKRIVGHAVELAVYQKTAPTVIDNRVRRVHKHFAVNHRVGVFRFYGVRAMLDKLIRQSLAHVESPAAQAHARPVPNNALLTRYELVVHGIAYVGIGHDVYVISALVIIVPMSELIPRIVRRLDGLIRTRAIVITVLIEIDTVVARVRKHAVENNFNPALVRFFDQVFKVVNRAEIAIDAHIVAGVVFMIGVRLEYRRKIDVRHAQIFKICKFFGNTL